MSQSVDIFRDVSVPMTESVEEMAGENVMLVANTSAAGETRKRPRPPRHEAESLDPAASSAPRRDPWENDDAAECFAAVLAYVPFPPLAPTAWTTIRSKFPPGGRARRAEVCIGAILAGTRC